MYSEMGSKRVPKGIIWSLRIEIINFPPEFFVAEITIPGKDEPETGIPVNFRHGNFRQKAEIPETFSGGKVFGSNFSNGKISDGKFSPENQSSSPRTDFSAGQQFEFFKKRSTDQLGTGSDHCFPRLVKKLNKFIYILPSTNAPLKL